MTADVDDNDADTLYTQRVFVGAVIKLSDGTWRPPGGFGRSLWRSDVP